MIVGYGVGILKAITLTLAILDCLYFNRFGCQIADASLDFLQAGVTCSYTQLFLSFRDILIRPDRLHLNFTCDSS
jgi:hypothetical protein